MARILQSVIVSVNIVNYNLLLQSGKEEHQQGINHNGVSDQKERRMKE